MAGMGQTCNHVAAAMYRVEAAVRNGLTNPACTSSSNEWLPNRKVIAPSKISSLCFNREDFGGRGKKKRSLVATPKKVYDPLVNVNKRPLLISDYATALEKIAPTSMLFTAVPKPKIDFVREIITKNNEKPDDIQSIDDVLLVSNTFEEFSKNLKLFTEINITKIEILTRGQSSNEQWYTFRKGVITASKAHEVITKMKKIKAGGGGYVNMWALNQKIAGLTFVNPNIPALKYGRDMEINAANSFDDLMKTKHKNYKSTECGLFIDKTMPYVGASPDRIMVCSCCEKSCLEIKCPYSINYTVPNETNLNYLIKNGEKLSLKTNHKYFTQCMLQMGVTGTKKTYFVVWTPRGMVIDEITFDENMWLEMKSVFERYYNEFYLRSYFPGN